MINKIGVNLQKRCHMEPVLAKTLKILHDLKCPISAYDTIVGWATRWNSNKVISDSSSSYKFKKRDQLLRDLAMRYDMTNMKPMQVNLQLQNSTIDSYLLSIKKVNYIEFLNMLILLQNVL